MSNMFKSSGLLNDVFDTVTESSVNLPSRFNVIDAANRTDSALNQNGGAFSATSNNSHDVNKLISMLTSDTTSNAALSETSTASLEQQLRDILNKNGGGKNKKHQRGGNAVTNAASVTDVRKFFYDLKGSGVNVDVKLNGQSMSEFFNNAQMTTTDISETSDMGTVDSSMLANLSATSDMNNPFVKYDVSNNNVDINLSKKSSLPLRLVGGTKVNTKNAKNIKKDEDDDEFKNFEQDGGKGANPAFLAMNELKKFMAKELDIKMGKPIMKVFSAIWSDAKKEYPDTPAVELAKKSKDLFSKNIEKYRKIAKSS